MGDKLLTIEEAAEILQLAPRTVNKYLREGKLPGAKLGGKLWRIRESTLFEWIGEQEAASKEGRE